MKIIVLLLILVVLLSTGESQVGGDGTCAQAEAWHRHEGLKYSMREDQAYHAGAALQAEELARDGGSCAGWENDREPVSFAFGFERPTGDKP